MLYGNYDTFNVNIKNSPRKVRKFSFNVYLVQTVDFDLTRLEEASTSSKSRKRCRSVQYFTQVGCPTNTDL